LPFVPEGQDDRSQARSAWDHEKNSLAPAGRFDRFGLDQTPEIKTEYPDVLLFELSEYNRPWIIGLNSSDFRPLRNAFDRRSGQKPFSRSPIEARTIFLAYGFQP
jgi:hypothetical protein